MDEASRSEALNLHPIWRPADGDRCGCKKHFRSKSMGKGLSCLILMLQQTFLLSLCVQSLILIHILQKKVWITLIYWNIKFSPFNVHEKKVFFFIIMREVCLFYCSDHLSSCLINTRLIFIYLYIFFWYIYRWKDLRCYLKPEETTLQKISIRWLTKQSSQFELLSYILLWWGVIEMEQT